MRPPSRFSVIPILILAAAICLWVFDTYRQASPTRPVAETREPAETSPRPSRTGGYETFHGCTLAPDRGNDGDSFRVKLPDGRTEIIRLYFVDTPESAFKSYRGGENNHRRIDQQAADMGGITPQQAVEIGKKAKSYAFIEVTVQGRPRFLHELLVEKGLARIHTKGAPLPDGTSERKHEDRLFKLQSIAKANESGAWGL